MPSIFLIRDLIKNSSSHHFALNVANSSNLWCFEDINYQLSEWAKKQADLSRRSAEGSQKASFFQICRDTSVIMLSNFLCWKKPKSTPWDWKTLLPNCKQISVYFRKRFESFFFGKSPIVPKRSFEFAKRFFLAENIYKSERDTIWPDEKFSKNSSTVFSQRIS